MDDNQTYTPGEVVYIIIRNPHAQDVANIQQAAIVKNPNNANELALFIHETYYPLTKDFAIFKSEAEAEQVFKDTFGSPEEGNLCLTYVQRRSKYHLFLHQIYRKNEFII